MIAALRQSAMLWSLEWPAAAALFETGVRVALVVLAVYAVALLLRRSSAAFHRTLWVGAVFVVLVVGVVGAASALRAAFAPTLEWTAATEPVVAWPRIAFWVWMAVAALLLLRLGMNHLRVRSLFRASTPLTVGPWHDDARRVAAQMGLSSTVALRTTRRLASPVTVGILRPCVMIPAALFKAPEILRASVLWHELTHVRRRDVAGRWLAALACALLWFHPLVWFAARRLRRECECASDDAVLENGVARATYVRQLLAFADDTTPQPAPPATIGFGVSELRQRIEAIAAPRDRGELRPTARIALVVVCCVALFAVLHLRMPRPRAFFVPGPAVIAPHSPHATSPAPTTSG